MPANPRISSQTTTLKCTWWPLTLIFTFIEVTKLGNMVKSVQEYLLPSKNQVALYSAKVPINPKITSQTTNLKCTWWLLTPIVTQLGNRTKSVQELPMAPNCQLLLTHVVSITLLWILHVMHRYLIEIQLVLVVTSIPWYSSRHPTRLAFSEHVLVSSTNEQATAHSCGFNNFLVDTPCRAPLPVGNTASASCDQYSPGIVPERLESSEHVYASSTDEQSCSGE